MSRIAERDLLGICVSCISYHIMSQFTYYFRPEKVIETVTDALHTPEMQQEESVFLLNLAVHYTKSVNFTTYQRLIDDVILVLKETELSHGERIPKYKAKIIWKSSTAICKEKAKGSKKEKDFRFFTSQVCTL